MVHVAVVVFMLLLLLAYSRGRGDVEAVDILLDLQVRLVMVPLERLSGQTGFLVDLRESGH